MLFRLVFSAILVLPGSCAVQSFAAETATVTVDVHATVVEPFMGWGVQWDPYEYQPSPEAWKLTLDRLDNMRPTFLRVMWSANPYCLGFDEAGNPRYAWSEGESAANERLQPLFSLLDYAQSRKIDVMLGEWAWPRRLKMADGSAITGPGDPRWARIIRDFVTYLTTRKKYTILKYYNYMNEPNGGWMWPGRKVDYEAWAAGIRNLRKEFDEHGLAGLPIAGPDNSGSWDWLDRCAKDLLREIGAWEMHWYAKDKEIVDAGVEKLLSEKREVLLRTNPKAASEPLFMGEVGLIDGRCNGDQQPRVKTFVYGVLMADFAAQVARAGWMGAAAWDLDDAMHVVNGRPRTVPPTAGTLKIWGFWNTQAGNMGQPEDMAIRPWYYTWSLMARLFPKGSKIVAAKEGTALPGLRTMASTWRSGSTDHISVMVVNGADASRTMTIRVPGAGRRAVVVYRYFDNDRPVDKEGYPVPSATLRKANLAKGVKLEMPSRGVVFLTTRKD